MKSKEKFKAGDFVELKFLKKDYKGILLEAPEDEKGIILLKLDSGYNIGFKRKDILEIKILKKYSEKKEKFEIKINREKPNIALIITGGTIASRLDSKTGGVDSLTNSEDFFKYYPEIFDKVNVLEVAIPFRKSSEDMDFKDWQKIARIAEKFLNDTNIKGVIITHGTDYLHYTGSALSFFLRDLNKPLVLTYSQRSIDRASSDATLNLECATYAAISDIAEIMLVGHANTNDDFCYALPAVKTRKMHTSRRDAFKVINGKAFARVYSDKIEILSSYHQRNKDRVKLDLNFEEKVALIKIYPGQNPNILDYYVRNKYNGLILEMSGLGHVPTRQSRNSWLTKLKEIQSKGIIVCATAQTIYGRLDPYVYSNAREILNTGVIYLRDMLSETALVKLGWVLGHKEWSKSKEKIKEKMLENISGEFSDKLEE